MARDTSSRGGKERAQKEKKLDRAVSVAMWVALAVFVTGAVLFVRMKMLDTSGQKIWELSEINPRHAEYEVLPDFGLIYLLSADNEMKAVDTETGKLRWNVKLPDEASRSEFVVVDGNHCLAYYGDTVWMCSSEIPAPLWKFTVPNARVIAEPASATDRVFIAATRVGPTFPSGAGAGGGAIVSAVNINSGALLWESEFEDTSADLMLAERGRVFLIGRRSKAIAHGQPSPRDATMQQGTRVRMLDGLTGECEWTKDFSGDAYSTVVSTGAGIVLWNQENMRFLSTDGRAQWEYALLEQPVCTAESCGGYLYISTKDGYLSCIDLASGHRKWMTEIGEEAGKAVVCPPLAYVSGLVRLDTASAGFTLSEKIDKSENLLDKALKHVLSNYDMVLQGIDVGSGETRWTIPKIRGDFEYGEGFLYALRYVEREQFYDASADLSEMTKTISNLGAYDAITGERIWETGIDGFASDVRLARNVAVVETRPIASGSRVASDQGPVRLIGISLR